MSTSPLDPPPDVALPLSPERQSELREQEQKQKQTMAIAIVAAVIFLALLVWAIVALMQPGAPTDKIRDVFIIVVAFESLIIGAALVILLIQLASLINLLQNEVRPILSATSETVNTLRGTVDFLGEEVVEPVVKLSGYLAGLTRMLELMGIKKK